MRNIREVNLFFVPVHTQPLIQWGGHRSTVVPLTTGKHCNGLWTKPCWNHPLGTQGQQLYGSSKIVVASHMEDKSWRMMRKTDYSRFPSTTTTKISKQQGWSSSRSDLWQIPVCHSQTHSNQSKVLFQSQHPSTPRTIPFREVTYVRLCSLFCEDNDAPSSCWIIARQLDHKRKFGRVFRDLFYWF